MGDFPAMVGEHEARLFRRLNRLPDWLHVPMWVLMQAGSLASVFVVAAAVSRRDRRRAVALALAGLAVWALVKPVKRLVGRGRPSQYLEGVVIRGEKPSDLGFPSGHAAVAMTSALIAAKILPRRGRVGVVAWALAVGAARQYVGAHLPLDVAGGAVIGASAAAVTNLTLQRAGNRT